MNWLKSVWAASGTAILAVLAIFAVMSAQRAKATAEKWQGKAVDIEKGNVVKGVNSAKAANSQAKVHEQKAKDRNEKAEARLKQIKESNEPVSSVLDQFRASS